MKIYRLWPLFEYKKGILSCIVRLRMNIVLSIVSWEAGLEHFTSPCLFIRALVGCSQLGQTFSFSKHASRVQFSMLCCDGSAVSTQTWDINIHLNNLVLHHFCSFLTSKDGKNNRIQFGQWELGVVSWRSDCR